MRTIDTTPDTALNPDLIRSTLWAMLDDLAALNVPKRKTDMLERRLARAGHPQAYFRAAVVVALDADLIEFTGNAGAVLALTAAGQRVHRDDGRHSGTVTVPVDRLTRKRQHDYGPTAPDLDLAALMAEGTTNAEGPAS